MSQIKGFFLYIAIVVVALIAAGANWLLEKLTPEPEEDVGYESARPNDQD